jgi:hypothetical protein
LIKAFPLTVIQAADAHMSMSTIFSGTSPVNQEIDAHENATLAAFVAHIERLQDQVREKDVYITELEDDRALLQQRQDDLLRRKRRTDTHIERLRTAIINREAMIGERENIILAVERQLEYHRLLLQAEIRRNSAIKLYLAAEDDSLPELTSLAKREDIDKWISKLNERLEREYSSGELGTPADTPEARMEHLSKEINFYVREIVYFKLDIKGYKSDIRKLKRTVQLGDNDSEASSLRPAATPTLFTCATPNIGAFNTTSSTQDDLVITSASCARSVTPTPSTRVRNPECTTAPSAKWIGKGLPQPLGLHIPTHKVGPYTANEADRIDSGISPRTVAPLSSEHGKTTVCASAV